MAKKKGTRKNSKRSLPAEEQPLSVTMLLVMALVGGGIFVTLSVWLRTPANTEIHLATHKTPKKIAPAVRGRTLTRTAVRH